jgi:hypothetical protein
MKKIKAKNKVHFLRERRRALHESSNSWILDMIFLNNLATFRDSMTDFLKIQIKFAFILQFQ